MYEIFKMLQKILKTKKHCSQNIVHLIMISCMQFVLMYKYYEQSSNFISDPCASACASLFFHSSFSCDNHYAHPSHLMQLSETISLVNYKFALQKLYLIWSRSTWFPFEKYKNQSWFILHKVIHIYVSFVT